MLPALAAFARALLKTPSDPPCLLFYFQSEQRFEVKFRNAESRDFLAIQCECGYPIHDFDEEGWY